jgi:hypothetical protein
MRRHRSLALALLALPVAGCGSASGSGDPRPQAMSGQTGSAASCAALSPAQQRRAAQTIVIGTMLPGPTVLIDGHQALATPAQLQVARYAKGHGPARIDVITAVSGTGSSATVNAEGIAPRVGERWEILSPSRRAPLSTSICLGSRRLSTTPPSRQRRTFTGDGL